MIGKLPVSQTVQFLHVLSSGAENTTHKKPDNYQKNEERFHISSIVEQYSKTVVGAADTVPAAGRMDRSQCCRAA